MRVRFLLPLTVMAMAILTVFYWFRPMKQTAMTELKQEMLQVTNRPVIITSIASNPLPNLGSPSNLTSTVREIFSSTNNGAVDPRELQLQEGFEAKNVPLNFYGQVLNQDGQPISGAQIKMSGDHVFYLI